MRTGHKGNEAVAPPCFGVGIGIAIEIVMEGRRPRRANARGARGQRGRCPSMFRCRYRYRNRNRHGGPRPDGLMRAGHEGNEAVAPPCLGVGIGIAIEIVMEGRRPRRLYVRGARGQRGRCRSMFGCRYWNRNRNRHGGPAAPAGLCARGMRATRPLPLHVWVSVLESQSKSSRRAATPRACARGVKRQRGRCSFTLSHQSPDIGTSAVLKNRALLRIMYNKDRLVNKHAR